MQLVDDLKQGGCQTEVTVKANDTLYNGWVCAKPINPRWWRTRIADAWQVFIGKAIAVKYFDDLTEKQKQDYVVRKVGRIT